MKFSPKVLFSYFSVFILGLVAAMFFSGEQIREIPIKDILTDAKVSRLGANNGFDSGYLDSLNQLVSEYKLKLSELEDENSELLESLRLSNSQLASVVDKAVIAKKISSMTDADVKSKLEKLFKSDHLKDIENPKAFAEKLTDIALEDKSNENEHQEFDVRISVSGNSGYIESNDSPLKVSQHRRLYANILSSQAIGQALVKWKDLSNDELIYFKGLTFGRADNLQYVWTIPNGGWKPGKYSVSLYSIDQNLSLISIKYFTIMEVYDEGPEPPYDTSQEGSVKMKAQ